MRTDQATTQDRLGFGPYRETLVGVFGAWGSGKTRQLLLRRPVPDRR